MKPSTVFARLSIAVFLVGAGLSAALAVSIARHPDLVAYGLHATRLVVHLMVAGFVVGALVWLGLARFMWKAQGTRLWVLVVALPVCVLVSRFCVLGLYHLEIKNAKGESNLRKLAVYCRDLPTWQRRAALIRTGILRAARLEPLPKRTPLNVVTHDRRERHGYSVENVMLETLPGFFLSGNLYRPASADPSGKKPIVLIPQGHFPHDRFNAEHQQLAATFARMGALAFLYDMVGRGESKQVNHHNPQALTLQLWNSIRVLDFLLGLPDADPTRVGMTGASGGGTQTFLCAAVDERVTVSASVVMVSSWVYGGCECEIGLPIHRGPEYASNNAEIAALAAPRPQLIVSCGTDWTQTVPTREFPYIRNIYQLFGRADNVRNVHLAAESHDFGPSKRQAVYAFFAEHLDLKREGVVLPDGRIDEAPNTVEPDETLHAIDAAHPLPARTLHGWDAVKAALDAARMN
jgi:dienelactone hydrolase